MNKTLIILLTFCGLLAGAGSVLAQHEKEPIEAYRVTTSFHTPLVLTGNSEGEMVGINTMPAETTFTAITPQQFGVHYMVPEALWKMILMHINENSHSENAEGFRIQIYAGSSLESANDAKADFLQSFDDDYPIYQMWNPPHFRVRIGDFLNRNEAMREVASIRQIFPDAFIVSDKVKLPKYKDRTIAVPKDGIQSDGIDDSEIRND